MLLLAGRAAGAAFGPDSYQERVEWATNVSPPYIVTLLARVARQDTKHILATPSPVTLQQLNSTPVHAIHSPVLMTTEIAERIRRDRVAALQRLNASVKLVSTPPTMPRPMVCSDRSIAAAGSVYAALARKMPPITPSSQCFKCAGAHSADQCRAPVEERISNILFKAKCCAQCALPLTKIGHYNLHPSLPGKSCNGSRFFVNMLMRQPIDTISKVFRSGNLEQQLELLASFIPL